MPAASPSPGNWRQHYPLGTDTGSFRRLAEATEQLQKTLESLPPDLENQSSSSSPQP